MKELFLNNYLNEMKYEKENDNSSDGVIYIPVL